MNRLAAGRRRWGRILFPCWLALLPAEGPLAAQAKKKKSAEDTPAG